MVTRDPKCLNLTPIVPRSCVTARVRTSRESRSWSTTWPPRPSLANPFWPLYLFVLLWPHPTPFGRRGQIFFKMLMARCLKMMLPWLTRVWRQQSISQNRWRNRQQANTHLGSLATHSEQQEIRPWSINWSWRQNSCMLRFLCLPVKIITELFHWNC